MTKRALKKKLKEIQKKKEEAIQGKRYELAAELRDQEKIVLDEISKLNF
jgi:protein-arginine kinase activator protein McsA